MPIIYRCNFCAQESLSEFPIKLIGIKETQGGILIPEEFHQQIFCTQKCFWSWAREQLSNK